MSGVARDYMTEDVTITAQGSVSAAGVRNYDGVATATVARLTNRIGLVKSRDGREVSYDRVFTVDADVSVSVGDRVTHDDATHEVLVVRTIRDLAGDVDHQMLYCGRT